MEEEYCQMRASFLMQYAPELLGEYAKVIPLKSEAPEDIQVYLLQFKERQQKTQEIPVIEFDINFHKFRLPFDNRNEDIHIIIEKNYSYYGVTKADVENKTKRYEDVI